MKKTIITISMLLLFSAGLCLAELQIQDNSKIGIPVEVPEYSKTNPSYRDNVNPPAPNWEFTHEPESIVLSYYDYMPGSYTGHPVRFQPDPNTGVYLIFFGRPTTADNRRIYWAYVYDTGTIDYGTVTTQDRWQGFSGMDIHPPSGDCIASWHEILPSTPSELNTGIAYDDYDMLNYPGFWSDPVYFPQPDPNVEEFIWPQIYIGPSPNPGYLRIYQTSSWHIDLPEDFILRYIDVPNDPYVYGDLATILNIDNWSDPIFIFDDWQGQDIRPYPSFTVDWNVPGKVAFFGYAGYLEEPTPHMLVDPGFYVWESYDGGETWSYPNLHSWPNMGDTPDVFYHIENTPAFAHNDTLFDHLDVWPGWPGSVTAHRSIVYDGEGNLHMPTPFWTAYSNYEEGTYNWFPPYGFLFQAEVVYKADGTWELRHVPLMPGTDPWTGYSVPWTVAGTDTTVYPKLEIAYSDIPTLAFHENLQNQAVNEDSCWMVQVWASGTKLLKAENPTITYPTPTDPNYIEHPIIHISASADNGEHWSEPIELSDIYSTLFPDFANQITVYPYVCKHIKDLGDNWGEIALFYMDDNDYGSFIQGIGPNTGGTITYMSVKINFSGLPHPAVDPGHTDVAKLSLTNYPNPFSNSTYISFSAKKSIRNSIVEIYNIKGQLIRTLKTSSSSSNEGYAIWDGKDSYNNDVASGIYLYRLKTNNSVVTKKMLLAR